MSRYDWPAAESGEAHEDDPAARGRFMARRRLDFDPDGARAASRAAPAFGTRAPPDTRTHLWQPLGPQTVIGGQAEGGPRISGRVNALAVHPLGERVYAASANGGVWYSGNGGVSWESLAGFASTDVAGITRPAHRNACGAIEVVFGATAAADVVWVGTGEVSNPIDAQPGSSLGGVGIFRADHPVVPSEVDPWKREANNLTGSGVYKIVRDPAGTGVVAATRDGLWQRPAAGGPGVDWERPSGTPFNGLAVHCTDALWTAAGGGRPARLWVWVKTGEHAGLWVRRNGAVNFSKVAIAPDGDADPSNDVKYSKRRAALAASTPPTQVWAFNDTGGSSDPKLFRVTNPGTDSDGDGIADDPIASPVTGVPRILGTQGDYDIAIDVHPTQANRVLLGGSFFPTTTGEGVALSQEGAVVVGDVALNGAVLTFGHPAPFTMLGIGVHADIHGVYFSNAGNRLYTCCDGGVFRSDRPQRPAGFYAANQGLQVVEANFVAQHPRCEGFVAIGLQDNASIERHSGAVWKRVPRSSGDGGGILLRPLHPQHLLYQYVQSNWSTSDGTLSDPDMLTRGGVYAQDEADASAFYSNAAAIATTRTPALPGPAMAVGQVIFGTTRVWYTEETRLVAAPNTETNLGTAWYTLPNGATPRVATDPLPGSLTQDAFGEAVTVCRWQDRDVAWVLGEGRVVRYARVPGSDTGGPPGQWSAETVLKKGVKNKKDATRADGPVRDSPVWTDIAVNLDPPLNPGDPPRAHGPKGALYLGTIGKADSDEVDTLWWFDGTSKWFKTNLRTDVNGVPAPVTAIVCDPAFPDEVYVGTTVGVWKGIRTQVGAADPAWTWHKRLNGVPEAAVEDLGVFSDGGIRLLRAAIAARGLWELRLDTETPDDLTYLRAHTDDLRLVLPPDAADPSRRTSAVNVERDGVTPRSWHGSPDVRPHTKIALVPRPPAAAFPLTIESGFDSAKLRRFQAALRAGTGDPRVRATGRWDAYFSEVLRDHGFPVVAFPPAGALPARNLVTINAAFWNAHMNAANAAVEPWGAEPPIEADLLDFTADLNEGARGRTSCTLPRRLTRVDVVVHHRGLDPRPGADVRVTLLKWVDPRVAGAASFSNSATWFSANVPWAAAVNEVLNSATGAPATPFGAGWSFVGSTNATRRKTLAGQTLDALHSGVATFEVNLAGVRNNAVVLLVAVIRAGTAPSAIAPATLEVLAMGNPNVAVRSLRATP